MSVTVKVEYDRLDEFEDAVKRDIDDALTDGALTITATAQQIVPVDTGRLRASIHPEKIPNGWAVTTDVLYSGYVERGTRNMPAQAYMRPSYERHRPGIIAACEAAIRRHAVGR